MIIRYECGHGVVLQLMVQHNEQASFIALSEFQVWVSCYRSYGSVFKAIHKETGQVVAIKQVPVESDLQEIIKEISIMQQCDR